MKKLLLFICINLQLSSCTLKYFYLPQVPKQPIKGSEFYSLVKDSSWQARETIVAKYILEGNMPEQSRYFLPIKFRFFDSVQGKYLQVKYFVTKDYLSIGTNKDFMRIPMTPALAQKIADNFHCFLPTRKMVNDIYQQATVKLEPQPLTVARDSIQTFYQHHLLIEEQRQGRNGLIAGIKKDVVLADKINLELKKIKWPFMAGIN